MSDPIRRALRGFIQTFIGSFVGSGVLSGFEQDGVVDWAIAKKAAISAGVAGLVAVFAFVQNWLEDNTQVPALLKAPASEGVNPVPDPEGGHLNAGLVTAVASVAMLVILVCWAWDLGPFA